MDEYTLVCEEVLSDRTLYEELLVDSNPIYREEFNNIISKMEEKSFLNDLESKRLRSERTPLFYGLP